MKIESRMNPVIPICLGALVTTLNIDAFKMCPRRCSCYDFSHFVDCKRRSLTSVPRSIPHGTWMLDIGLNNLSEIPGGSFRGLWSARIVVLSGNRIHLIHSGAFESLIFLENLDLDQNRIAYLPGDFSDGLQRLLELRLANNHIESIRGDSLLNLESLQKLDLSGNWISSMDRGVFRGLSKLRTLLLKNNRLVVLEDGHFHRLQSLEALHLENNNISDIQEEALGSLRSLSLLGLSGNHLSHVKFKTFLNIQTQGTHLHLAHNPWKCDCDLQREFGKILSVRHLHVDDYGNITCSAPGQLLGYSLVAVDSQLCVAETATVLVITGTVLVTVIAAIVMAERNRKKTKNKSWNDSDGPFDPQEK
ncbi:leucine-rich repeat-containing protein 4-like isoform X2 [Narcine bancroftii]